MRQFKSLTGDILSDLTALTDNVEIQKLKAIGQRNRAEHETEEFSSGAKDASGATTMRLFEKKRALLQNGIRDKREMLHRIEAELESLKRVEAFQREQIETLEGG